MAQKLDEKHLREFDKAFVRLSCRELRDFIETTSDALEHARVRFEDYVEQTLQPMSDSDEKEQLRVEMDIKKLALAEDHPHRLFNSCFLTAYFYLEDRLCGLATKEGKRRGIDLEISDLGPKGVEAAKLYLTKVCKIKFPNTAEWQDICKLRQIRNCLVHRRGRIGNNEELQRYLASKGLQAPKVPKGMIHLTNRFCTDAIDIIERFMLQVMSITV